MLGCLNVQFGVSVFSRMQEKEPHAILGLEALFGIDEISLACHRTTYTCYWLWNPNAASTDFSTSR
jgi:hypothetical protein